MVSKIIIPNTDLKVFPIGLGTARAGLDYADSEANRIFDAYLDMGGNLIDTAHVYSDWVPPETARSERVLGDWLNASGKRNKIVLMTKGGHPDITVTDPDMHKNRMTAADMRLDLESSLKKLQTDVIDIYFYHRDDPVQSVEDSIEIMEGFVKEGKIRYYGCSNWSAARMAEADSYCKTKGYRGFAANEALLNIGLNHMAFMRDDTMLCFDDAMLGYHRQTPGNLAIPYMGLCGGFFHTYIQSGEAAAKNSNYYSEGNIKVAIKIKGLMEKYSASVTQVLLGFFRFRDFACAPLVGPLKLDELEDAMSSPDILFEKDDFIIE